MLAGALSCASPVAAANYAPFAAPPAADPAAVASVDTNVTTTAEDQGDFDKYFYFHRENTDFASAYADLNECDSYARAVGPSAKYDPVSSPVWAMQQQMITQYGMAGAAGGAIGGIIGSLVAAEIAAAEQRKMRRKTMLTCMGFKEYRAYGVPKKLWVTFNSEGRSLQEEWRVQYLQMQAKLASGSKPSVGQIQ